MRHKLNATFPIIEQMRSGPPRLMVRDLTAGITVAAVLVPQGMAYAELAGLPAVNGLYASFVPLLAYALLGSSRQLALGPTATVAVLTATVIAPLSNGSASQALALGGTLALLVGGICVLGGLLRGGFVVNFLSQPVLSGYVTGAALVIVASQLGKILGYSVSGDTFFQLVAHAITNLGKIQGLTVLVAALSAGSLVLLRRFAPRWPAALIVVALAITAASLFDLSAHGVAVTGTVPSGLPSLTVPKVGIHDLGSLAFSSLGVALVCYVESIAVAKAMADRRGYEVDPNRELVAIGVANLGAGLFQAFPVNGSFSRTASASDAGARTQLSGVVAAVVVGLTLALLDTALQEPARGDPRSSCDRRRQRTLRHFRLATGVADSTRRLRHGAHCARRRAGLWCPRGPAHRRGSLAGGSRLPRHPAASGGARVCPRR